MKTFLLNKGFFLVALFFISSFSSCTNVEKEYYSDGQLKTKAHYQGGKLNGARKTYYKNGQLKKVFHYKNDTLHGEGKEYYKNGQLKTEGQYHWGKQDGMIRFYYKNGQLKEKTRYDEGREAGVFKKYYSDGELKVDGMMRDDTVTQFFLKYNQEGKLEREFRLINVKPENDTIALGESFHFEVNCPGPTDAFKYLEAGFYVKNWSNVDTPQYNHIRSLAKFPHVDTGGNLLYYNYTYDIRTADDEPNMMEMVDSNKIIEQKQKANQKTFSFEYKPEDTGKHKYMGFYRLAPKDNGVVKHNRNYGFVVKFFVRPELF